MEIECLTRWLKAGGFSRGDCRILFSADSLAGRTKPVPKYSALEVAENSRGSATSAKPATMRLMYVLLGLPALTMAGKQPQRATGSPEQPNGMENRSSNPPMWSTARVRASGPKQCCVDGELGGVRCIGRADEGHSCSKWIPPYCVYISPAMDSAMDSLNSLARRDGRAVWVRGRLGVRAGEQEVQDTGRVPGSEGKGEPVGGWRSVDRDPSRGRGLQILREKSVVILHLVG